MKLQHALLALCLCLCAAVPALGRYRNVTFRERFVTFEDHRVTLAQRFTTEHGARRPWRGHRRAYRRDAVAAARSNLVGPLVTVPTAAGISITVAGSLAAQFKGFIADLVAQGYTPRHIGCFANGGHVAHSRH